MTVEALQQPVTKALEYWRAVVRYQWYVLMGSFALLLLATTIITRLPNVYEATTTILVDPQQVPERYVLSAVNSDPSGKLNTITQAVLSRTRLQEIVTKFHLQSEATDVSDQEFIEQMRDRITIQVKQGSGPQLSSFTISFQAKDPAVAADVTNELASSFIQWNVNSREQQVQGTEAFLASELESAKRNLETQEDRLKKFKMSHLGETPDQASMNMQALTTLPASLQANIESCNRLEQEKILLTRLPQAAMINGVADPTITKRARLEAERHQLEARLDDLQQQYSDKYPDVIQTRKRLDELNRRIDVLPPDTADATPNGETSATKVRLELIDKELKRLKVEQARIQARISSYQSKIDAAPLREQELLEISRNYDVSKQHYQTLLDKSFNIQMAASLEEKQKGERFTVLDAARVPEKPVKPRRKMLVAAALLFSLFFPGFVVICKETLSNSIKTEAELKSLLPAGARIVALIPQIESEHDRRREYRLGLLAATVCLVLVVAIVQVMWQMRTLL
jgi:polysaccharide biosynthesis transport protein